MGSGSSRMRGRAPRPRPDGRARLGLASFLCIGAAASSSSSAAASSQMEDQPSKKSVISARADEPVLADDLQGSVKESPLNFSSENRSSSSMNEHIRSNLSSDGGLKECSTELRNAETSDSRKCLSESKELIPCLANASSGPEMTHSERTCDLASTSSKSEQLEPVLLTNVDSTFDPIMEADESTNGIGSQTSPLRFSNSISQLEPPDLPANGMSTAENPSNEVSGIHGSGSNSASAVSSSSSTWQLLGEESILEATPSVAAFLTSSGSEEQRNGSVLHVDVMSISSNGVPNGAGETSSNEARRNSRRLFWDAFSRRSTRRNYDSPAMFSSTEDTDDLGSHDRWLLDISDDLFSSRFDYDSVYLRRRSHGSNGRRRHSRSEIRERLRGGFNDDTRQTTFCPSGLHPDGTCSCDSLLMAEESSTRASISRIVMLAEALFEVLDEIHHQPVSLSLSMVSLPAPESVVDSLPVKSYTKHGAAGGVDDVEQCYICLAEYEEGDEVRVLPCRHEYHMSCVDKWLKEIHGVCPLCRGDVCEGTAEGTISNL